MGGGTATGPYQYQIDVKGKVSLDDVLARVQRSKTVEPVIQIQNTLVINSYLPPEKMARIYSTLKLTEKTADIRYVFAESW